MKKYSFRYARRLLAVALSLTILLTGMVWSGTSADTGSIDYDFEYNPGQKYAAVSGATNNTYHGDVQAWLYNDLDFAQSGTGAMKLSYLSNTSSPKVNPAFRIFDEDDTEFAPTKNAYYRITFSYYVEAASCSFEMRVLFVSRSWASRPDVTADSYYTLASVTPESETGKWVTVSQVVKCGYDRAHFALYAPGNGVNGTTVYIDDLKMEKLADTTDLCTLTLDHGNGTVATQYAFKGAHTPPSPLKAAHTLVGWYTDATLQTPYDGQLTGNTTLYARWVRSGEVSHPDVMDFEHVNYSTKGSINLSVGTAEVVDTLNHTLRGGYSLRVTSQNYDQIAGNTRPQFNLTNAAGDAIRVKAGEDYRVSFWIYVADTSAVTQARYWITVTESTVGYTNQKDNEVVREVSGLGSVGAWVRETFTLTDLPRDGYMRLGICGTSTELAEFYLDDIHVVQLDPTAVTEDYEEYVDADVDFVHRGSSSIVTGINHTEGGSRSLQLPGISWSGLNRNQMTLIDPATREPYVLETGKYYTLSMWVYTTHENFTANIWLWCKDEPYESIPTSADKASMADEFAYDGTAYASNVTGNVEPGVWNRIELSFVMGEGPYLLLGMTNGKVMGGGYTYYLDDIRVAPATPSVITLVNSDGNGGTQIVDTYVGLKYGDVLSLDKNATGELAGLYLDAAHTQKISLDSRIADATVTLYAEWRPWTGTCQHSYTCDTICRICGQVEQHQVADTWSTDATGHWRACTLCGTYVTGDRHTYGSDCDGTCEVCGYDRGSSHTLVMRYTATGHHALCSSCGDTTAVEAHVYTDATDPQCDHCGYVRYQTGDLDGDGDVDQDDVYMLAYHLFLPEYYPFYQQADFNRDGKVNSDDALYLQHYLQDPVTYPLTVQQTPVIAQDDGVYSLS